MPRLLREVGHHFSGISVIVKSWGYHYQCYKFDCGLGRWLRKKGVAWQNCFSAGDNLMAPQSESYWPSNRWPSAWVTFARRGGSRRDDHECDHPQKILFCEMHHHGLFLCMEKLRSGVNANSIGTSYSNLRSFTWCMFLCREIHKYVMSLPFFYQQEHQQNKIFSFKNPTLLCRKKIWRNLTRDLTMPP